MAAPDPKTEGTKYWSVRQVFARNQPRDVYCRRGGRPRVTQWGPVMVRGPDFFSVPVEKLDWDPLG